MISEIKSTKVTELHVKQQICTLAIVITLSVCCTIHSQANEVTHLTVINNKTKEISFIFKSPKGDVTFNHNLHQIVMKTASCLPCHKTKTPTKELSMSRFDQKAAHSFCKGCHKLQGGPVECHECHKLK